MLKYEFKCYNEVQVRAAFEHNMLYDAPSGRGIFGSDLWDSGIHFKECGKRIKGFYLQSSEGDSPHGSPIRVVFNGGFLKKADGTYFVVYIYPRLFELLFILFAFVILFITAELFGLVFCTLIFIGFMYGYIKGIKEAADIFRRLVR